MRHYRDKIATETEGDLPNLAWLARNILELRVWIEYCSTSEANALEFYDDALRDLVDLNRKHLDELEPTTRATLEKATEALPNTKETHKYKDVRKAAEECHMDIFDANYKILSKLAHPTALSVIAHRPEGSETANAELTKNALELAEEGLLRLERSHLGDTYRKYRAELERVNAALPPERRVLLAND